MVKPPLRTRSIGFKVSEEEYAQLEAVAQASGRTLGEWCREAILRGGASNAAAQDPALAEIIGVRLLRVNVRQPMAAGETGSSGQGFFTYRNNTTYFNKADHLSTPRVSTGYTGTEQRTESNLPFGDGFSETASPFVDYTGFAGGIGDISNASNTDHFGARDYAKTQGRWLTPDPAGLAAVNP